MSEFRWNTGDSQQSAKDYDFKVIFNKFDKKFRKKFNDGQRKTAIILAILFALIGYYLLLPPLNIRSRDTWLYIGSIVAILTIIGGKSLKGYKIYRTIFLFMSIGFLILNLIGIKPFQSRNYAQVISLETSDFKEDIEELPLDKIPTLDRDSAVKLGSRKMGELLDLVSQFDIDDSTYTQINFQDYPFRVTPLKYNGFIKYLFNMRDGLPGYMMVDIVDGDAELIKLNQGIKISKHEYFFRNIYRYARIRYPFDIFGQFSFEIDEEGTPYWVISTLKPKVAFFDALDVNGAILVNAITGDHIKYNYNEIPQWIDRLHSADTIITQLDWHGLYQGGFINSLFAQKNVLMTTEGYNYLALNDDVYLYTGYTSVAGDQSNVGFVLVNLRTKEADFYPVSSAKEYSAMDSAEGAVQEKAYRSTFPLLLNVDGQPTYFLSLKDNAGLIKQYAFIDAQNYQNVAVGNSVSQALNNHKQGRANEILRDLDPEDIEVKQAVGEIEDIQEVVIEGNSYYYILLYGDDKVYVAPITVNNRLPFLRNESISFEYYENANINEITNILEIN